MGESSVSEGSNYWPDDLVMCRSRTKRLFEVYISHLISHTLSYIYTSLDHRPTYSCHFSVNCVNVLHVFFCVMRDLTLDANSLNFNEVKVATYFH